jgi:putative ABC transport system permease protein
MSLVTGLATRLRAIVRGRTADRELDEEIRFHLEQETEKHLRLGLPPDEARRRALVAFGGVTVTHEEHRDSRGARWAADFLSDARFALRALARSPALAVAAIVTLALGVGANTMIFSAVNAVMLQPLPLKEPGRLVMLWEENPEKNWHQQVAAPANVLDWREQVPAFEDVTAFLDFEGTATLTGQGEPQLLKDVNVFGNFFSVLGVRPILGRAFTDEETWDTGTRVAVISHRAWRMHFGGDSAVVGRSMLLDGVSYQIVGVMPEGFSFPYDGLDVWEPAAFAPTAREQTFFRRAHFVRPIARLGRGVTAEQADAQLQSIVRRLQQEYPATNRVMGAGMTPLHEFLVGTTRRPLLVLLGAVGLLLLIACANVGNLLLVQAASRERETALRLALGAGRSRVVRQSLTETLVLALVGGGIGLALGAVGTRALVRLQPEGLLRVQSFGVDWTVAAYVLAITTASGLLFGALPALWSGRRSPAESLRTGRSGGEARGMRRWGDALVVAEVALSLALTVGAGLVVRTFWELQHVDPGFDPHGVLATTIQPAGTAYDSAQARIAFFGQLMERVGSLPGVESVALTSAPPLAEQGYTSDFAVAGRPADAYGTEVAHRTVTSNYLRTMRVPLRRGRDFGPEDATSGVPVVLINERLAEQYFRGEDPVGQRIAFDKVPDSTSTWYTIVGVVGAERQRALTDPAKIEVFHAFEQTGGRRMTLLARTGGDPGALAPSVRAAVSALDPSLAIVSSRTMEGVRQRSLALQRFLMVLMLVFAVVGLVLAIVGVYGVLAHLARRRTREMGIRIALGAQAAEVRWLVVRHGLRLTSLGLAIGAVIALLGSRTLRALLYGVAPWDPLTLGGVAALLALTSVLAAWLPANRASRADPMAALRAE